MEIAKFILTAVGTFLSVSTLSFALFQYWKKKQDEKFDELAKAIKGQVGGERDARVEAIERMSKRIEILEEHIIQNFQQRLSAIEGELKGFKPTLQAIQNWFINNTPTGGK
jgi:hypothetical protein